MRKYIYIISSFIISLHSYSQTMNIDSGLEHMSNATLNLDGNPAVCEDWPIVLGHGDGLNLPKDAERTRNHSNGDTWARTLRFKAKFDNGCAYTLPNNNPNQLDWNKLLRIAEFPGTDFTSVRLGWRWNIPRGVMEVGLYGHIRHHKSGPNAHIGREFLYLTDVQLNTFFDCELILSGIGMGVIVNGVGSFIKREDIFVEGGLTTAYNRSAYFGGQECPPNDMAIRVERINGDDITNWADGACDKTFSRSIFYDYDNFTINAARTITLSEQVYRGQFASGNTIPTGYSIGDEIPWFQSDGDRFVTIKDGADITFKAGDKITLKTGFHAEAGSKFKASINSNLACASFTARYTNDINDTVNDNTLNNTATNINSIKGTNGSLTVVNPLVENVKNTYFKVFPNPTKHSVTLITPDDAISNVTITDMLGNVLFEAKYSTSENNIDVSNLPNGIYFIKANTMNKVFITKLVKE